MKRQFSQSKVFTVLFLSIFLFSACFATDRIMPLGDSITRGVAGSSNGAGYRRSLYLSLTGAGHDIDFVGSSSDGTPTDFDKDHEGHDGWHADQIRDNVNGWLTSTPADTVLLHIGTNDISGGQGALGIAAEIDQILDNIDTYEIANSVAITVILAKIIDRYDHGDTTEELNSEIQSLYNTRTAAGDELILVDMFNALDYSTDLPDGIHPNDAGYVKMANVWFNAFGPNVNNLEIASATGQNLESEDILCTYDLIGTATTSATAWYKESSSIMELYLPMEGGSSDALNDYSGNGITATVNGDTTWSASAGHDGKGAFIFDGTGDDINAGENFPINGSYTKTAWVYRTGSGAGGGNNIITGNDGGGGHAFWAPDPGNLLSAGHNGTWDSVQDSVALALDTWYFVALTYDAVTDEMILYKNGAPIDSATVTDDVTDATISIGSFGISNGFLWMGTIDDARVYNEALTAEQIAALYAGGSGDNDTLVAEETVDGQMWQAAVTPFAPDEAGTTAFSAAIMIGMAGPAAPDVNDLEIASASDQNLETEDILCTYNLIGTATTSATAWYKEGIPLMELYLPMEGGSSDALNDYSGNGFTVTTNGNTYWSALAGHDGNGAFIFDGTGDYLNAGENFPINGSYTKTAWVYSTGSGDHIISSNQTSGGHVFWAPDPGNLLSAGHNGTWDSVQDSVAMALDTWYFVALTYDAATDQMILYKDGASVDSAVVTTNVTLARTWIGSDGIMDGNPWTGTIDDVRVYNEALAAEQIAALYAGGSGDNDTLVAEETVDGQMWHAAVTPFSADEAGDTESSTAIIIGMAGPAVPDVNDLEVASATGQNMETEDILCTYNLIGTATTSATTWYKEGSPLMELYLPMEGGSLDALNDYSGNGITATVNGDTTWSASAGHDGNGAFIFDGTGDDIRAGENFPINSSYTKTAWVYRTGSGASGGNNIITGNDVGGGHAFWAPEFFGNKLSSGHNGTWDSVQDSVALALDTWYFVALTYDAVTDEMILYKNGAQVDSATVTDNATDTTISIGSFGHNGYLWMGTIDDVRIYNYALSAEQIAAMYDSGSGDNNTVVAEETIDGQMWQAAVTPFSVSGAGVTTVSDPVLIMSQYDLDLNGSIGLGDLRIMSGNWLNGPDLPGDFYKDGDDIVNFLDFAKFASAWLAQ